MISMNICRKNLNKREEELCGDTSMIISKDDSDIIILSDGMGSGVRANILSTLTTSIIGTMLKNGDSIDDCVETIALTLPIDPVRQVAYSTISILQVDEKGNGLLVEYDTPACVLIRDGKRLDFPYTEREIAGKMIREYHFEVREGDYLIQFTDGVTHAGVGGKYCFGWGRTRVSEFAEQLIGTGSSSCARIAAAIIDECSQLYDGKAGDDTTVIVSEVTARMNLNLFSGPPKSETDDEQLMREFMASPGYHVVSGGTSATIAARYLDKPIFPSLMYDDPDIPPTAEIEGLDLVTEGVLTLNRAFALLQIYNEGEKDEEFFEALDNGNGGARLARMIIEKCSHLNMYVGRAMNEAHQAAGLPFDLSIRMRLIDKLREEAERMGKKVTVKYY